MASGRRPAVAFIFVTLVLDILGLGLIIPILPKLIEQMHGGNTASAAHTVGLLGSLFAVTQFVCSPILGSLSDRWGRRPIILTSLFGAGLDYLLLAWAPTLPWFFIGRIVAGITSANISAASAYIADVTPPEKRAASFGLIGAAFGIGFVLGPALGGWLGEHHLRLPFLISAGLVFANWLYGYFILPESLQPENRRPFDWKRANPMGSLQHLRKYPVFAGLITSLLLLYTASHAVQGGWSYYTMEKLHWDERMVGLSLGAVGIVSAIVQGGLIRVIIPKLGQERSVYVGLGLYCLGFLLFAFSTQTWMMFAFIVPYCLGGIAGPALQGIISGQVPPNEQGELQGGLTSLLSVAAIIGPPLMGNLFAYFTAPGAPIYCPGAAMLMGAALAFVSTILAWRSLTGRAKA